MKAKNIFLNSGVFILLAVALFGISAYAVPKAEEGSVSEKKVENPVVYIPKTQSEFEIDKPIILSVELKNPKDHLIEFQEFSGTEDYRIIFYDENGQVVPLSKEAGDINKRGWSNASRRNITLKANSSITKKMRLGNKFEFPKPGTYQVVVIRHGGQGWDKDFLVSNLATIKVKKKSE